MTAETDSLALVLASASPRRRELLERVGVRVEVVPANVDETPEPREDPVTYVSRIAAAKASVVRGSGRWVLAADTAVVIDGAILGKANNPDDAAAMLRQLSGRSHQVMTAFVIDAPPPPKSSRQGLPGGVGSAVRRGNPWRGTNSGEVGTVVGPASHRQVVTSDVEMVTLDDHMIADYVSSGEWQGKAGAYAIQGMAAAFVKSVRGSVTNIIGLPLAEVLAALSKLGGPGAHFHRGVPA